MPARARPPALQIWPSNFSEGTAPAIPGPIGGFERYPHVPKSPMTPVSCGQTFNMPAPDSRSGIRGYQYQKPPTWATSPPRQLASVGGLVMDNWAAVMTRRSPSVNSLPSLHSLPASMGHDNVRHHNHRRRRVRSMIPTPSVSFDVATYRGITAAPGQYRSYSLTSSSNSHLCDSSFGKWRGVHSPQRYRPQSLELFHVPTNDWREFPEQSFMSGHPRHSLHSPDFLRYDHNQGIRGFDGQHSSTTTPARRASYPTDTSTDTSCRNSGMVISPRMPLGLRNSTGHYRDGVTDHIQDAYLLPRTPMTESFFSHSNRLASPLDYENYGRVRTDYKAPILENAGFSTAGSRRGSFSYAQPQSNQAFHLTAQSEGHMADLQKRENQDRTNQRVNYNNFNAISCSEPCFEQVGRMFDGHNEIERPTEKIQRSRQRRGDEEYLTTIEASTRPYTPDQFLGCNPTLQAAVPVLRSKLGGKNRLWNLGINLGSTPGSDGNDAKSIGGSSAGSETKNSPKMPNKFLKRFKHEKTKDTDQSDMVTKLASIDPVEGIPTIKGTNRYNELGLYSEMPNASSANSLTTPEPQLDFLNNPVNRKTTCNFTLKFQERLTRLRKFVRRATTEDLDGIPLPGCDEICKRRIDFKWHSFLSKKGYAIAPASGLPPLYVMPSIRPGDHEGNLKWRKPAQPKSGWITVREAPIAFLTSKSDNLRLEGLGE